MSNELQISQPASALRVSIREQKMQSRLSSDEARSRTSRKAEERDESRRVAARLTDLCDAGEEDPDPDDEGCLDARELDADDMVLRFRRELGVVVGGARGDLLRVAVELLLSGSAVVAVVAAAGEAAQGGVVRQRRSGDRAHGPEAQAGVRAVRVTREVAGVDLRPVRRRLPLHRDPFGGVQLVETRGIGGAAASRAPQEDGGEEQRADHRDRRVDAARTRRRCCRCRGQSAPSSAHVARR